MEPTSDLLKKESNTKAITVEQLATEIKGIYDYLVVVEKKCIEVDNAQSTGRNVSLNKLSDEQWKALIALHCTYLNEHCDFLLASQHPAANEAVRLLPIKYSMPARMWRYGIHRFLEVLRNWLPASYEHMISFIYLAYSTIALLFETAPAFEKTWMECLGVLARYRMAIEMDDNRDQEIWAGVSRQWYSKASDKFPTTGRLYHHLAVLPRHNAVQQLFYYLKSLCVENPFIDARKSIMTLFDRIISPTQNAQQAKLARPELLFVKTHGILFCMLEGKQPQEDPKIPMNEMFQLLDLHITRSNLYWCSTEYHIGLANICALMGYGFEGSPIAKALKDQPSAGDSQSQKTSDEKPQKSEVMDITLKIYDETSFFPWKLAAEILNTLLDVYTTDQARPLLVARMESDEFPASTDMSKSGSQSTATVMVLPRPLPNDYALRGFSWVENYFPRNNEDRSKDWFANDRIDDEEKYLEQNSMAEERKDRCLWLGHKIAMKLDIKWLRYDSKTHRFSALDNMAPWLRHDYDSGSEG